MNRKTSKSKIICCEITDATSPPAPLQKERGGIQSDKGEGEEYNLIKERGGIQSNAETYNFCVSTYMGRREKGTTLFLSSPLSLWRGAGGEVGVRWNGGRGGMEVR
jgi:hypothetical protein